MELQQIYYPESRLGGFTRIDGTLAFYNRVNALLSPESLVVDVGCGRGAYGEDPIQYRRNLRILKGKCRWLVGMDVDPRAENNPYIDEFRWISQTDWPVESGTIDLCLADNILEHLADPPAFFKEANRILKPGGTLCIRTPNAASYVGMLARLTTNRSHPSILQKVKSTDPEDVFPTLYRCNTLGRIRRQLQLNGFEASVYGYEAEPSYLSFGRLTYFLGVLHQRYAPEVLRVGIHAFGRKM